MSLRRISVAVLGITLIAGVAPLRAQTGPDLSAAERVYDAVARQFQDGRLPPELELTQQSRMVASFDPKREVIVLEAAAQEVARSLGADSLDALAYLIGHELAHFYGEHDARYRFRELFRGLAVVDTIAAQAGQQFRRQEMLQFETEADLKAGFAAYLAGYRPLPVAPALLRGVYARYGLDTARVGNHPPLADRVQVAKIATEMLDRLVRVFEGGVNLLVIGRYEEAARVFDHLARAFPSREMLSNAGTARALQALSLMGDEVRWAYPFELDVESRLMGDRGLGFSGGAEAERLLREAQGMFDRARLRDPSYVPAWVNLAAVHQLLGDDEFAIAYAARAIELAAEQGEPAPGAHALVVRGIARAETGDAAGARADFEAAAAAAPAFSEANLQALSGEEVLAFASDEQVALFSTEAIGSLPGDDASPTGALQATLRRMGEPEVQLELPASGDAPEVGIYAERFDDVHAFAIGNPASSVALVLQTPDGYEGETSRGVKVGDSLDAVRDSYGNAGQVIATRQGAYHVYDGARIAIAVDATQRVTGWLIWFVSE